MDRDVREIIIKYGCHPFTYVPSETVGPQAQGRMDPDACRQNHFHQRYSSIPSVTIEEIEEIMRLAKKELTK